MLALILGLGFLVGCSKPKTADLPPSDNAPKTEGSQEPLSETPPISPETPTVLDPVLPVPTPPETTTEKPVEKTESIWNRLHPSTPEPSVPPVVKEEPLRIYYQKDPLPEAWLTTWSAGSHVAVKQTKFSTSSPVPVDGDIYLFTPEFYSKIVAGPGALALDTKWARGGLDPAFTQHPFDVHNAFTRPFRWTPYLVYGLVSRKTPWKDRPLTELWADPKTMWPDDTALWTGLVLKEGKMSANPQNDDQWISLYRSLQTKLQGKTAAETDCWTKLLSGEIEVTLLPASYRLLLPAETQATMEWTVPSSGTLVVFEQIAVGAQSKKKDYALALAEHLLKFDQQKRLLAETGYFSVRINPKKEAENEVLRLAKKDWFSLSEFLEEHPVLPKEEIAPTPAPAVPGIEKGAVETESIPTVEKPAVAAP